MDIKSYSNPEKRELKWIWILNLIPFLGLGYLYAVGIKGWRMLVILWLVEIFWGSHINLFWLYLILSIAGSGQLNADQAAAKRLSAKNKAYFGSKHDNAPEIETPATQVPMAQTEEFALSTLETKAKRAEKVLKRMSAEQEVNSKYAVEGFEQKVLAAEKILKAQPDDVQALGASEQCENKALGAIKKALKARSNEQALGASEQTRSATEPDFAPPPMDATPALDHQDYSHVMPAAPDTVRENNPFFSKAELAADTAQMTDDITEGKNNRTPVDLDPTGTQERSQTQSTSWQSPTYSDAEIVAVDAGHDQLERNLDAELAESTLLASVDVVMPKNEMAPPTDYALDIELPRIEPLPEVAPELRLPTGAFDDSSFGAGAAQMPGLDPQPDVAQPAADFSVSANVKPTPSRTFSAVPDVTMPEDQDPSFSAVPDVTTPADQNPSLTVVPEVSANPDQSFSLGNFEEPKFSFSFEEHLSNASQAGSTQAVNCPKCGAAKNDSFSFCLACGHAYD